MAESAFCSVFGLPEMPVLPFPAIYGNRQIPAAVAGFAGYPFRGTGKPAGGDAHRKRTNPQISTWSRERAIFCTKRTVSVGINPGRDEHAVFRKV